MRFSHTIIREIPVTVDCDVLAPSTGARESRYGPAIEPDDAGGVEFNSITGEDGKPAELSDDEIEELEQEALRLAELDLASDLE